MLSHAVQQQTSHFKYRSDTLMHTSLKKNTVQKFDHLLSFIRYCFLFFFAGSRCVTNYSDFLLRIYIPLFITLLLNVAVPVVYLYLVYFFCYKTSTPFILCHHLLLVLIGHLCVQVFQIEDT